MKIDRQAVYEKYNGRCAYCGEEIDFKAMQVDHIRPKARFHVNHRTIKYHHSDPKNLNPACRVCNNWKHVWSVDEFRNELELQAVRLRKYSAQFRIAERFGVVKSTLKTVKFYFEKV